MVSGSGALRRQMFRDLPRAVRRSLRNSLAVAAGRIVDVMEQFVPVDESDLLASIGWVWGYDIPDGSAPVGRVGGGDPDLTITIFAGDSEAFYSRFVEFGTQAQAASPFFFPAYRIQKNATKRRINKAVRDAVRRVS